LELQHRDGSVRGRVPSPELSASRPSGVDDDGHVVKNKSSFGPRARAELATVSLARLGCGELLVLLLMVLVIRLDTTADESDLATIDGIVGGREVLENYCTDCLKAQRGSVAATAMSASTNSHDLEHDAYSIDRRSRDKIFTDCGPNAPNGPRWRVGHEDLGDCFGVCVRDGGAILDAHDKGLVGSLGSGRRCIGYCGLVLLYATSF
jgi:hypothetical protein